MKRNLKSKTGWYNSVNSLAHITISEFYANDRELISWKTLIKNFTTPIEPFEVILDKTGSYSSGAFYLSPDNSSKRILASLMKRFHKQNPFGVSTSSTDPHISIGRKLTLERLKIANQLWGNMIFDLRFLCDNIALRKLNEEEEQFNIIERFYFMNDRSNLLF